MGKNKSKEKCIESESLVGLMKYLDDANQDKFVFMGACPDGRYLIRWPKPSCESSKNEDLRIIHICDPERIWRGIQEGNAVDIGVSAAYVHDGACVRCNSVPSEDVLKKAHVLSGLHKATPQ